MFIPSRLVADRKLFRIIEYFCDKSVCAKWYYLANRDLDPVAMSGEEDRCEMFHFADEFEEFRARSYSGGFLLLDWPQARTDKVIYQSVICIHISIDAR